MDVQTRVESNASLTLLPFLLAKILKTMFYAGIGLQIWDTMYPSLQQTYVPVVHKHTHTFQDGTDSAMYPTKNPLSAF